MQRVNSLCARVQFEDMELLSHFSLAYIFTQIGEMAPTQVESGVYISKENCALFDHYNDFKMFGVFQHSSPWSPNLSFDLRNWMGSKLRFNGKGCLEATEEMRKYVERLDVLARLCYPPGFPKDVISQLNEVLEVFKISERYIKILAGFIESVRILERKRKKIERTATKYLHKNDITWAFQKLVDLNLL